MPSNAEQEPEDDRGFVYSQDIDGRFDLGVFEEVLVSLWVVDGAEAEASGEQEEIDELKFGYDPYDETRESRKKGPVDWSVSRPWFEGDEEIGGWVIDPDDDNDEGGMRERVPVPRE